ncbi:MAG: hypothetical protein AAFU60_18860, partial [Bacteroidota bacterium]
MTLPPGPEVLAAPKRRKITEIGGSEESTFLQDFDKPHYVIITFSKSDISLTGTKTAVSDFHRKYFKLEKLRTSNIY